MRTYLVNQDDDLVRIDLFRIKDNLYWGYYNDCTINKIETKLNKPLLQMIIIELCNIYNWEFIGEVE
jgi:hypothetical protein